jgi:hypothetical protein
VGDPAKLGRKASAARGAQGILVAALAMLAGRGRYALGGRLKLACMAGVASYSMEGVASVCSFLTPARVAVLDLQATPPSAGGWLGGSPVAPGHDSATQERN